MIPFHFQDQPSTPAKERCVVLPANVESKADLFAFLQHELPLPAYFGHNWDALEECLGDLDWLGHPKIALIHQDIPMEKMPSDQRTYLQILAQAARESNRLHIVFPEQVRPQVTRLLTATE